MSHNSYIFQFIDAVNKNDIDSIETLIKKGADVDAFDNNHNTPLFYAITNNNYKIAKLLIDNFADVNCYSGYDRKILSIAILNQNIELSKLLIDSGVVITNVDIANVIKLSNVGLLKLFRENGIKISE